MQRDIPEFFNNLLEVVRYSNCNNFIRNHSNFPLGMAHRVLYLFSYRWERILSNAIFQ